MIKITTWQMLRHLICAVTSKSERFELPFRKFI